MQRFLSFLTPFFPSTGTLSGFASHRFRVCLRFVYIFQLPKVPTVAEGFGGSRSSRSSGGA